MISDSFIQKLLQAQRDGKKVAMMYPRHHGRSVAEANFKRYVKDMHPNKKSL